VGPGRIPSNEFSRAKKKQKKVWAPVSKGDTRWATVPGKGMGAVQTPHMKALKEMGLREGCRDVPRASELKAGKSKTKKKVL